MFGRVFCAICILFSINSIGSCFEIQPRVVNGTASVRGQFPFFVLLFTYRRYEPKNGYTCGATLLNERFVLTVAHCLDNVTKVEVNLGSLRQAEYEQDRHVFFSRRKHFYIHPEYIREYLFNDIALIKLTRPAIYSHLIQPVAFTTVCEIPSDMDIIAIGNGYNETDGELASILKYTTLTTVPFTKCKEKFMLLDGKPSFCARSDSKSILAHFCIEHKFLSAGFLFSFFTKDSDICQGDSGGPVIHSTDHTLYGLVSMTDQAGCEEMPQGFTNVIYYFSWISEITGISLANCD